MACVGFATGSPLRGDSLGKSGGSLFRLSHRKCRIKKNLPVRSLHRFVMCSGSSESGAPDSRSFSEIEEPAAMVGVERCIDERTRGVFI